MYRRIVSYIRQCLTVALCLDDEEVVALGPSFPALSTCPSMRFESWSDRSMQLVATRSLGADLTRSPAPGKLDQCVSKLVASGVTDKFSFL